MKLLKAFTISSALFAASMVVVPSMQAQSTFHRITHVNFSGPVEIPGKVLPAGDYVIQLDVLPSNETSIVEIRDKDGQKTLATLLTIPDYRLTPTGKTVILFRERAGNSPAALRAWFYPGENYGHEFAYPMREAKQIANANHMNVPAVADNTADNDLKSSQVTEAKPDNDQQAEVASNNTPEPAPAATPAPAPATTQDQTSTTNTNTNTNTNANSNYNRNSNNNNLVASSHPLPKTASPLFSIVMMGGFFLAAGLGVGFLIGGRSQEERSL
jgi:hypothetical protein